MKSKNTEASTIPNCESERIAKEMAYAEYLAAHASWVHAVASGADPVVIAALLKLKNDANAAYVQKAAEYQQCLNNNSGNGP